MIADVWCPWCRDHQRAELAADRDAQRTRAEAAEAECERLRAIVEGRTVAPTDAEIAAHAAAGGLWLASPAVGVPSVAVNERAARMAARGRLFVRWWALSADGTPCPWPQVGP